MPEKSKISLQIFIFDLILCTNFMFFNSRIVALFLALLITLITVAFVSLTEASLKVLVVMGCVAFGSAFILIYLSIEFLIFKELENIYKVFDGIKRGKFPHLKKAKRSANPLRQVNQDILNYANTKQQEIEELKKLEIFRREFIADISHELKTPLFAAQGFVLTLLDGAMDDDEVRYKFLKKAAKSLNGLNILVEDLLTLSQIESGHILMKRKAFDLKRLTEDVIDQFEHKAQKKEIYIELTSTLGPQVIVKGDSMRIAQVMTNLIGNAVKYSNQKSSIRIEFTKVLNRKIRIIVRDNGPGIPQEHIARIFERFYRVEKSRSKKQGGTGLGLAIVKHIIEKHDSKVYVKSKLREGTTFQFDLEEGNLEELLKSKSDY